MKKFGLCVALCTLLITSISYAAPPNADELLQQSLFLSLLLDSDPEKSSLGARSIGMVYPRDESLCDVIAEKLMRSTEVEPRKPLVQTVEWYVRVLGELKNPRYLDVLRATRARTTNKNLLEEIDKAIKAIGTDTGIPYEPGTVQLAAKKAEAAQKLLVVRRDDRSAFNQVKNETALTDVLNMLGTPDDMTAWTARVQKLLLHYAGQGLFVLTFDRDPAPRWIVAATYPELLAIRPLYNGENFGVAQTLGSFQGRFLMAFLKSNGRQIKPDIDALTVLAKRLETLPFPTDDYEENVLEKGLAWLARSSDPKAMAVLEQVTATVGSSEGKAMAQKALDFAKARREKAAFKAAAKEMEEESDDSEASIEDTVNPGT